MSLTEEQARTEIVTLLRTAWELGPPTDTVPLFYDDVEFEKPTGVDANGRALPWARISVRFFGGEQETLGPAGSRRFLNSGLVTLEVYTASGDGHTAGGPLARVGHLAFRGNQTSGGVWFTGVTTRTVGNDGPWTRRDVTADFRFEDRG